MNPFTYGNLTPLGPTYYVGSYISGYPRWIAVIIDFLVRAFLFGQQILTSTKQAESRKGFCGINSTTTAYSDYVLEYMLPQDCEMPLHAK